MSSHILRFHESVDKAYARPSDAFADLRRIAREVPQDQREAILDHLFDTGMRERRPFLSFNDRRVGVFIGSPWCIWEEWRILRDERSKCGEGETNVSTEWARSLLLLRTHFKGLAAMVFAMRRGGEFAAFSRAKCKNATEHLPQGRIQGICHRLFVFYLVIGEPCGHGPMRPPISRSMKPVHSGSPI